MPDIATIAALLNGLKAATDIAKSISQASNSLQAAELKMKLAELYEALADARIKATDLKEEIDAKDQEIARLLDAAKLEGEVFRGGDAYFRKGASKPYPLCIACWDQRKKLVHLLDTAREKGPDSRTCPECKTSVSFYSIEFPM